MIDEELIIKLLEDVNRKCILIIDEEFIIDVVFNLTRKYTDIEEYWVYERSKLESRFLLKSVCLIDKIRHAHSNQER